MSFRRTTTKPSKPLGLKGARVTLLGAGGPQHSCDPPQNDQTCHQMANPDVNLPSLNFWSDDSGAYHRPTSHLSHEARRQQMAHPDPAAAAAANANANTSHHAFQSVQNQVAHTNGKHTLWKHENADPGATPDQHQMALLHFNNQQSHHIDHHNTNNGLQNHRAADPITYTQDDDPCTSHISWTHRTDPSTNNKDDHRDNACPTALLNNIKTEEPNPNFGHAPPNVEMVYPSANHAAPTHQAVHPSANHEPWPNHNADPRTNQVAGHSASHVLTNNQMMNQMHDPAAKHAHWTHNRTDNPIITHTADPCAQQTQWNHQPPDRRPTHMADPSPNYAPLNNQMVNPVNPPNHMTDFGARHIPWQHQLPAPSATEMSGPNTYYGPQDHHMAVGGTCYGLPNQQVAAHSTFSGPLGQSRQMAAPRACYRPLNRQPPAPSPYSIPFNQRVAVHNAPFGQPNQHMLNPNIYYKPLNHHMAAPNYYGLVSHQYAPLPAAHDNNRLAHFQDPHAPGQIPDKVAKCVRNKKAKELMRSEPYIKKPPNAFMLFMQEQRPQVVTEYNIKNNAMVNSILGKRWKSMSREEQAPYYELACKEKLLHIQRHPNWCHMDNYGKKRKRVRGKAALRAKAAATKAEPESPPDSKSWFRSLRAEGSSTASAGTGPPHPAATVPPPPPPQAPLPASSTSSVSNAEMVTVTHAEEFLKMLDDIELPPHSVRLPPATIVMAGEVAKVEPTSPTEAQPP